MTERIIDNELRLIPYYRNDEASLPWYQDVSLRENSEIAVVVCKEYQNQHIGRRCVLEMLKLAREKGMERVKANIYSFNGQSQRMFQSVGFEKTAEEWYESKL